MCTALGDSESDISDSEVRQLNTLAAARSRLNDPSAMQTGRDAESAASFAINSDLLAKLEAHSRATLVSADMSRRRSPKVKKEPEVEWQIPKRIVTRIEEEGSGLNQIGALLSRALEVL